MAARYRLRPLSCLHWRRWDDDFLVFDDGSGHTHQLHALAATVLLNLEEQARSIDELVALASDTLGASGAEVALALPATLTQLGDIGLLDIIGA